MELTEDLKKTYIEMAHYFSEHHAPRKIPYGRRCEVGLRKLMDKLKRSRLNAGGV